MRLLATPGRNCILTNTNVWSPCGQWIVYDTRSDAAGTLFDGTRIEMVHADTGEIRTIYESRNGACCGVASWHPTERKVAFILGPEHPTPDYQYGPSRRQGVIVNVDSGPATNLDARDLSGITPGALSGGSHVHIWHPLGDWLSFTYDDDRVKIGRTIAVAEPGQVVVNKNHPRNHDGNYKCRVVADVVNDPKPGSDEISKACEEAWIGHSRMLAFQGTTINKSGVPVVEVFVADCLTNKLARLTYTTHGITGPRHWLRSSKDNIIACLMPDRDGTPQLHLVNLQGELRQLTSCDTGIQSAFTWSPCRTWIYAKAEHRISRIDASTGLLEYLTEPDEGIRPEACVVSPDGKRVAFVRHAAGVNSIGIV